MRICTCWVSTGLFLREWKMDMEYIKISYSYKAISPWVSQNVELLALSNIKPTVIKKEQRSVRCRFNTEQDWFSLTAQYNLLRVCTFSGLKGPFRKPEINGTWIAEMTRRKSQTKGEEHYFRQDEMQELPVNLSKRKAERWFKFKEISCWIDILNLIRFTE